MTSFETNVRRVLVETVPLPTGAGRDWADVLTRSATSMRTIRTRRLTFSVVFAAAVAVVLAVTPLGAVIARGFGNFSGWLGGKPGQPVSRTEQRAVEHQGQLSWALFPRGTKFRRLIVAKLDGIEYKLYGYRAGDMFCLRLLTPGASSSPSPFTSCLPRTELTARRKPVLPLYVDAPIIGREKTDLGTVLRTGQKTQLVRKSSVTFGIVSDGVSSLRAFTRSNLLHGIVTADSFLIVNPDTRLVLGPRASFGTLVPYRNHVRSLSASAANGDVVRIRVAGRIGGEDRTGALMAPLSGPEFRMAKRPISGVRIGWLYRREPRGTALSASFWRESLPDSNSCGLGSGCGAAFRAHEIIYSRLLTPDPGGVVRIALNVHRDGETCVSAVLPQQTRVESANCMPRPALSSGSWSEANTFHFSTSVAEHEDGSQYSIQAGLVDDEIRRMTLLLVSGKQIPIRIKDNAYVYGLARTDYPVRLVAYNRANRVVAVETDMY